MNTQKTTEFIKFVREDGTIEMRHKDHDALLVHPEPPSDYVVIPQEEVAAYHATAYQRQRVQEYPPIGDQLDALFKAGVFPADMAAAIQAVKDKYPKGTA